MILKDKNKNYSNVLFNVLILYSIRETIKELNIVEFIRKLVYYNGVCLS